MSFRYLCTSSDGRINRKPFWIARLILMVVAIAYGADPLVAGSQ